jgi:hypothetical protein
MFVKVTLGNTWYKGHGKIPWIEVDSRNEPQRSFQKASSNWEGDPQFAFVQQFSRYKNEFR